MVRNRIRKCDKDLFTEQTMKEAVDLVIKDGLSIRKAAERKGVARNTLHTYVKKVKSNPGNLNLRMRPNYSCRKIFNDEEEQSIEHYLIQCSQMNYKLTKVNVHRLVYQLAMNHCNCSLSFIF